MAQWTTLVLLSILATISAERWGKLEPEYTLRSPYSTPLTNWRTAGAAAVEQTSIKFLPQLQKVAASLWTQKPVTMKSWEVILEFGVQGPAPLSTGEGLAFWHAANPDTGGPVYGHSDKFDGLGIFFDSYDADGNGEGEPYVLAMYNDGKNPIDADGAGIQLGVCFANYRSLPHPARAKITYTFDSSTSKGQLTVGLDIENTGKFKSCISVKDVALKAGVEHFGLTVSDYASDFEIFSFLGINLDQSVDPSTISNKAERDVLKVVEDEAGKDGLPVFESHTHFMKISGKLQSIGDRLFALDEQFTKQFQAVFHNHDKSLEFHVTKLQTDVSAKHSDTASRLDGLVRHVESIQKALQGFKNEVLQLSEGKRSPKIPEGSIDGLAKTKLSCMQDNNRGEASVGQLKEMVATLQRKQDSIRSEVENTLQEMDVKLESDCSSDSLKVIGLVLLGVLLGGFAGAAKSARRTHLL